jgi:hypothetical protein
MILLLVIVRYLNYFLDTFTQRQTPFLFGLEMYILPSFPRIFLPQFWVADTVGLGRGPFCLILFPESALISALRLFLSSAVNLSGFVFVFNAYFKVLIHPDLHVDVLEFAHVPLRIDRRTIIAPPYECIQPIFSLYIPSIL